MDGPWRQLDFFVMPLSLSLMPIPRATCDRRTPRLFPTAHARFAQTTAVGYSRNVEGGFASELPSRVHHITIR